VSVGENKPLTQSQECTAEDKRRCFFAP